VPEAVVWYLGGQIDIADPVACGAARQGLTARSITLYCEWVECSRPCLWRGCWQGSCPAHITAARAMKWLSFR
jgi:hypothetical protein